MPIKIELSDRIQCTLIFLGFFVATFVFVYVPVHTVQSIHESFRVGSPGGVQNSMRQFWLLLYWIQKASKSIWMHHWPFKQNTNRQRKFWNCSHVLPANHFFLVSCCFVVRFPSEVYIHTGTWSLIFLFFWEKHKKQCHTSIYLCFMTSCHLSTICSIFNTLRT